MIKKIALAFSLLFPLILLAIYFQNVKSDNFLFLHDEFLLINKQESFNAFFTQNQLSLGTANTTVMLVTFFERLYYFTTSHLGLNLQLAQRMLYFIKLFILIIIPLWGFEKLSKIFSKKINILSVFAISIWYSFNTFTLIYFHGNAFSLTILISYILAPLTFYYYHKTVFDSKESIYKYKMAILLFLMSFGLYFYTSFIILLIFYTIFYTLIFRVNLLKTGKNLLVLALAYSPFLSLLILIPYEMFFSTTETLNIAGGETFTNLRGGFLYPLLMWFSWGIYTEWQPRNIFTFTSYFRTIPSLIAPFIIYALLLPGIFKKKKDLLFLLLLAIFLIFLFFIKGAQAPFGEIYNFLIANFAPFRVYRSPESKIGFVLIFLLALLLIRVATSYKNKLLPLLLGVVILIQGYLIFNGTAIIGENSSISSDRIIKIPADYYGVASFINENSMHYGYVMPIPSREFGHYIIEQHKRYIGQDILPKLTTLPFIYISENTGISTNTYKKLSDVIEKNQIEKLSEFPIKYVVVRNDTKSTTHDRNLSAKVTTHLQSVYKNRIFTVYKNRNPVPLIQGENLSFNMINPIKYRISITNIRKEQKLSFYQSYNPNWTLYPETKKNNYECNKYITYESYDVTECASATKLIEAKELGYIFKEALFINTHADHNGYANSWTISPSVIKKEFDKNFYTVNKDGSVNLEMILYFKTQSIFYLGIIVAFTYLVGVISYILWHNFVDKKSIKK